MVPDHLQWLLHRQGNKRNPALTILWNRRSSQGKHTHTHRGHTFFAPVLFRTVLPIDYITIHFMLQGRIKQQVSSALCSEADMFLSRARWKWKGNIWEPTWRISNNSAVNLPVHQGSLSFPHCASKTKKGSAGPSVLAYPCPSSMPPLPAALRSCPTMVLLMAEHCSISRRMGCWQVVGRWGHTCWLLLGLGGDRHFLEWDFLDAL